jgi:hypothetical protein
MSIAVTIRMRVEMETTEQIIITAVLDRSETLGVGIVMFWGWGLGC